MNFLREHRKFITVFMAVCFLLWTIGMGVLMILPVLGK